MRGLTADPSDPVSAAVASLREHGPVATDVTVRSASADDREAILGVVREAFSDDTRDGQVEVDIAIATWSLEAVPHGLELVAEAGRTLVGHVLSGRGDLSGRQVVGIAPLAVAPDRQGTGVGTALMNALLRRAELAGLPLVVLLGRPAYYERFGFEPSEPLGISYLPVGAGNPDFQVRRFPLYEPSYRGAFTYCWEQ